MHNAFDHAERAGIKLVHVADTVLGGSIGTALFTWERLNELGHIVLFAIGVISGGLSIAIKLRIWRRS